MRVGLMHVVSMRRMMILKVVVVLMMLLRLVPLHGWLIHSIDCRSQVSRIDLR